MAESGTDLEQYSRETASLGPVNVANMSEGELSRTIRISKELVKADRMFGETAHQAFAKMMIGRDLGISPTQALMGIDFVRGGIQLRGVLLASFVRKSPDYDYRIISLDAEMEPEDEQHCTLRFFKVETPMGEKEPLEPDITFTMAMAKKQGNVKTDSAWMTARRNMLLWRAMSDGVKFHCPDLLAGLPVYAPEEIPVRDVSTGQGSDEPEPADMMAAMAEWIDNEDLADDLMGTIDRARRLGHAGYSNYHAIKLALSGQEPMTIAKWLTTANKNLDKLADSPRSESRPSEDPDGDFDKGGQETHYVPVEPQPPEDDPQLTAEILEGRALQKADEADAAEAANEIDQAGELRAEAERLHEQAEAMKRTELS